MLDTVKLKSPPLDDGIIDAVHRFCSQKSSVTMSSGEVEYSITSGLLDGSFDERVSVRVLERESNDNGIIGRPIVVEGSVHKAMMGHNVHGGPVEFAASCRWFIDDLSKRMGIWLPAADVWEVRRVDVSECYEMPSYEAAEAYIESLKGASYPRRRPQCYGLECVMFPGVYSTWKVYHKGPEFQKHDARRLRGIIGLGEVEKLQHIANKILRVELSIHAHKLDRDFAGKPSVVKITRDYLESVHDVETGRVLREGKDSMQIVRNAQEVQVRLRDIYGGSLARILYATYVDFATFGEDHARRNMARPTFFRQRKQLVDAGVSWQGSDIHIERTLIPADFSIRRDSPYRMLAVASEVAAKCSLFMRAA